MNESPLVYERKRMEELLLAVERMAGGDVHCQAPISGLHDELDAISHGVNVLVGELHFRLEELQKTQSHLVQSGKLAALGEVSSGLAHELNNPLAIIRGYVEMALEALRDSPKPTVLERYLKRIDAGVDRMDSLIRHVMEFSRLTDRKHGLVSTVAVIAESFILLHEQLRLKNIQVVQDPGSEELFVWGDKLRLEQVLINLITNARDAIIEAHGEKGGCIRVCVHTESTSELLISVRDNGIGMNDVQQGNLFNPFYTTKEAGKGTGLGLSISLGIIREHEGSITCRSRPGEGTEFTIRLPRRIPATGKPNA